ncbi:probable ADP-ribosylation factor GTPase-activating protein AGD14 isoform X2 [Lycium barbarum]|uniref:probable ADP-ribosylation factor GTPase-activating protein AGD14 isoform X2 n=1 Tax=Lycium barbarum TaxID=112863 RepID=UPI00293F1524|nr:probable ADP-ribosylation factor GTPase-activating protein AGD14 isoform X2 [Lycium barbarum]
MNKMFNKMKEEERIEKIIRGLLKLQDNRRCINCNSLGPQYICTTFWTFVCTRCSGVHREFTHRVKSVSMARFSEEEVSALEAGGNERAKEIYFKAWDPYRNSYPDPSDLHRLREFIKHVYVDRKYTGERGRDKLPVVKTSLKDDYKEMYSPGAGNGDRCSSETYSPRKRSDDINLRSYSNIEDRRSPRNYNQGKRSSRERSLPTRFEIVDDRFRDEGTGDVKRYQYHIFSKSESRRTSSSPSSPKIHSIKDILGDKVIPLEVGESPKQSGGVTRESSANDEKMAKEKEKAAANIGSLIDLETEPQPQPQQQAQQTDPPKETSNASAPPSSSDKVSSMNLLESLFIDMSTPPVASTEIPAATQPAGASPVVSGSSGPPMALPESTLTLPGPSDSTALPIKNQHSAVSMGINGSNVQPSTTSFGVVYGQQNTLQPTGNAEAPPTNPSSLQPSQAASMTALNTSPGNDPKSIGRKELPADLFTMSYPPLAAAVPGWQFASHGMAYGMQYHPTAMAISALPNSARSRNPFDIGQDGPQVQAPEPQPQPLPYALAMPPQTTNYGMTIPRGVYVGQQIPNNMALAKPQGNTSFGKDDSTFSSLNPLQQSNPVPATSNSFSSVGGNPFG